MLARALRRSAAAAVSARRPPVARAYHQEVIDHFEKPLNVGSLDKDDPTVGTGLVGAPACGDVMKLQIKVDDDGNAGDGVARKASTTALPRRASRRPSGDEPNELGRRDRKARSIDHGRLVDEDRIRLHGRVNGRRDGVGGATTVSAGGCA